MKFSELKNGDHYSFTCLSVGWSEEPTWIKKYDKDVGTIRLFDGNEYIMLELWGKELDKWKTQNWQGGHWFEIENARMKIDKQWGDKLKWCTGNKEPLWYQFEALCKKDECEGTKINLHGNYFKDIIEYKSHAKKSPNYKFYIKILNDNGFQNLSDTGKKILDELEEKITELKKIDHEEYDEKIMEEIKKIREKHQTFTYEHEIEFYKKTNINAKTLKIFGENIEKCQEVKELMKDAKKNYLEYKPKFDSKLLLEEKTSKILTTDKIELNMRIKAVMEEVPLSDINNKSLENIKNKLQILKRKKTQKRNKDKRNDYKF